MLPLHIDECTGGRVFGPRSALSRRRRVLASRRPVVVIAHGVGTRRALGRLNGYEPIQPAFELGVADLSLDVSTLEPLDRWLCGRGGLRRGIHRGDVWVRLSVGVLVGEIA